MSLIRNVSLVKEASWPHVYFVCGGVKLWIPDPAEFDALGFDWNQIQVMPDGALAGFLSRPFVALSGIKPSSVHFDAADDGNGSRNTKSSSHIVQHGSRQARNVMLAGWLWENHHVNIVVSKGEINGKGEMAAFDSRLGVEDVFYDIVLDPDFLQRMYGLGGLSNALKGLSLPGGLKESAGQYPLPFEDQSEVDGTSRGVTMNSFLILGSGIVYHCELNAWHKDDSRPWYEQPFWRYYIGRGPAPANWHEFTYSNQYRTHADNWFPFDPLNPNQEADVLRLGDYVILKGTLWQDSGHFDPNQQEEWPGWAHAGYLPHTGWLEIHPVDWVIRVNTPLPGMQRTYLPVELCTNQSSTDVIIDGPWQDASDGQYKPSLIWPPSNKFYPAFDWKDRPHLKVREVEELIDGRFTDMETVWKHFALNWRNHLEVQVGVKHTGTTQRHGRFKATYLVTWEVPGPAVCSSNPDATRLDIFARGSDDAIYYKWYEGNPWTATPWHTLFGTFTSDPAAVAVSSTLIYVFARGSDDAIWFSRVDLANHSFSATNWQSMGGAFTSSPAACALTPNQLFVFARGRDKALWYTRFNGQTWENWSSLGGVLTSDPAAVAMRDLVEVYVRGSDEAIYHLAIDNVGNIFPWERSEGYWTSAPAVCSPDPVNYVVDLFARGSDNAMWHRHRDGLNWQPWRSLCGVLLSDPAAVDMMGTSYVFARGADERLWFSWLTGTHTQPWQPLEVDLPPSVAQR